MESNRAPESSEEEIKKYQHLQSEVSWIRRALLSDIEDQERQDRVQHDQSMKSHAHQEAQLIEKEEGIPSPTDSVPVEHTSKGLKIGKVQLHHPST